VDLDLLGICTAPSALRWQQESDSGRGALAAHVARDKGLWRYLQQGWPCSAEGQDCFHQLSGANGRGLRETKLAEAVQQRCLVALEPWPGPAGAYSPLQGGKLEALHTKLDEGSQVRLADPAYGVDIRTGAVILGQVP
jgi:hypothetical protein